MLYLPKTYIIMTLIIIDIAIATLIIIDMAIKMMMFQYLFLLYLSYFKCLPLVFALSVVFDCLITIKISFLFSKLLRLAFT